MNALLWIIQILLAALFLFAGVMKLILPLEKLTGPVTVPGLFLRFFACEEDLSNESPDARLPDAVAMGAEPLLIIGAMAGG